MIEPLRTWLAEQMRRPVEIVTLRRIATGHSRAMWFVELDDGQRLVVRVEQGGVFGTSTVDEFELMRAAAELGVPVAPVRWLEPTGRVLGQPFFAMDFFESALGQREDRTLPDDVAADFIRRLHELHSSNGTTACSLPMPRRMPPTPRSTAGPASTAPRHPWPFRSSTKPQAWLHRHAPELAQPAIVHGDPGPGNFLHDGAAVVAFTDWEFAHIGDPMEDWVYLISMRGARTMTADRWRQQISDTVGVDVTDWDLRYWGAFNFFKGACANLTCLQVFGGPNPAPNMAIIGTALQQTFMRNMADLVAG
jgi:aminoglycoside phosphotransferase (APT) family kinase protein